MAIPNYWQSSDGDTLANASWSLGHPPAGGEHGIADGRSQHNFDVNQNNGATGGDAFITTEGYHGNVGSAGAPYNNFAVNNTNWIIKGDGDVWLEPLLAGPTIVTDMASGGTVTLSGDPNTVGNIYSKSGRVIVLSGLGSFARVATFGPSSEIIIHDDGVPTNAPLVYDVKSGRIVNKKSTHPTNSVRIHIGPAATFRQEVELSSGAWVIGAPGGVFEYLPSTGAKVPSAIIDGLLDISEASFAPVAFGTLVLGPNRDILGSTLEDFSGYTIDLSKNFPLP